MKELERFSDINISDINTSNVFFSVVSLCKEKGIFSKDDLVYVDTALGKMIEETARYSKKGYIKKDIAIIMLKNVFMILDSVYTVSDFREIIFCVKERKLYELWQRAVGESGRSFDRVCKNFANLEHFHRKNKNLGADFAVNLLSDCNLENIFTYSFDRKPYTKEFFGISDRINYSELCRRSEILCTECGFLDKRTIDDIYPILKDRNAVKKADTVNYNSWLIDCIVLSMMYGAFYRCPQIFPPYELYGEISSELCDSSKDELCEAFLSYLKIAASRYDVRIVEKGESVGENILNIYSSRVCEENLQLLSQHLAEKIVNFREKHGDIERTIYFI